MVVICTKKQSIENNIYFTGFPVVSAVDVMNEGSVNYRFPNTYII